MDHDQTAPVRLAMIMPRPLEDHFRPALAQLLPDFQLCGLADAATAPTPFALTIAPPRGVLRDLSGLRCVMAPGAGVDHILADPTYPRAVPLARMVQPDLRQRMLEYVVLHVLRHHRGVLDYEAQQRARTWSIIWPQKAAPDRTVGVLGLGALGAPIAQALAGLGFATRGWSRTPKLLEGVTTFSGPDDLSAFLSDLEIVVNLLPATPETSRLMDAARIAALAPGAGIVSAGRGATMVEADILAALESGHLSAVTLDVFEVEPLPTDHPFWRHPRVTITPHCASAVTAEALAEGVRAIVDAVLSGKRPPQEINLERGY